MGMKEDEWCKICCEYVDTEIHMFINCSVSYGVEECKKKYLTDNHLKLYDLDIIFEKSL